MSEQTISRPAGPVRQPAQAQADVPAAVGTSRVPGAAATEAAGTAARTPRTPPRPVLSIALVMFVPAAVLVLDGNLSVQTALVRFAAALLVSWAAARLVWATVRSAASTAEPGSGDVADVATASTERTAASRTGSERTAPERAGPTPGMP